MVRGEGTVFVAGVSAQDAFDFVLDPAQYTKADTRWCGSRSSPTPPTG